MGIYWPTPVIGIYWEAIHRLNGNDFPLKFGPAHIVWGDENFEDCYIEWCLEHFDEYREGYSDSDLTIARWSLEELLKIPEGVRCSEDYDMEKLGAEEWMTS